jgi:hypothetical protein
MGHKREDLTRRPFRFWPLHKFMIVYVPESEPLAIAHIFGPQDLVRLLK